MKTIKLNPTIDVNGLSFGSSREQTRKEFGKKYKEMKKSILSKKQTDWEQDHTKNANQHFSCLRMQ